MLTATPAGCTGGSPVLTQTCTYVPPIDGAALYTQHCFGCHANGKKGSSASSIQTAITGNVGGMGSAALRALTPAQIAAIAAAP
ncbi:MAG: cytochrome c [Deltaproteobacteria bacterium]|nr:cytochrome c [Deltaproteobacteria bacterium]